MYTISKRTEQDARITARIQELMPQRFERVIEAGYAVLVKLPNKENEELRAVLQVLMSKLMDKKVSDFSKIPEPK